MSTQAPQGFWLRRRAAVEAEARMEAQAQEAALRAQEAEALAEAQAEKTDTEILNELGLNDPDAMQMGDDFSAFMNRAVPEHLRRRALRVLWRSNPVLANLDGLCDHNDDFSDAATVMPDMKTAYQVGKGMMKHVIALAEAAEAEAAAPSAAVAEDITDADTVAEAEAPVEADARAEGSPAPTSAEITNDAVPARARRMRFAYAS